VVTYHPLSTLHPAARISSSGLAAGPPSHEKHGHLPAAQIGGPRYAHRSWPHWLQRTNVWRRV